MNFDIFMTDCKKDISDMKEDIFEKTS